MCERMAAGWIPPVKTGENHVAMIAATKRKCPFKKEISTTNLGDKCSAKYPLTLNEEGDLETFTQRKIKAHTKKGSPEYHQRMSDRSKKMSEEGRCNLDPTYWKDRQQSPEHIARRFAKIRSNTDTIKNIDG